MVRTRTPRVVLFAKTKMKIVFRLFFCKRNTISLLFMCFNLGSFLPSRLAKCKQNNFALNNFISENCNMHFILMIRKKCFFFFSFLFSSNFFRSSRKKQRRRVQKNYNKFHRKNRASVCVVFVTRFKAKDVWQIYLLTCSVKKQVLLLVSVVLVPVLGVCNVNSAFMKT